MASREKRPALYHAGKLFSSHPDGWQSVQKLHKVIVVGVTGKYLSVTIRNNIIFSQAVYVAASNCMGLFAILNSTMHFNWTHQFASKLETRLGVFPLTVLRPSRCRLAMSGSPYLEKKYIEFEESKHKMGLTNFYNAVHSKCQMILMTFLHQDQKLINLYGWDDIKLDHKHREVLTY